MADVLLKDITGKDTSYVGVETVSLRSIDGETTETFVSERLIQNQVQADWAETDTESPAYILHKPEELPEVDSSHNGKLLGVSDGKWTIVKAPEGGSTEKELPDIEPDQDKGKVLGVVGDKWDKMVLPEVEPFEQKQVDWNENDEESVSYINNRPFGISEELCELVEESTLDFYFDESYGFYVAQKEATDGQIALWANNDWNKAYVGWGGNNIYLYESVFTDVGRTISDERLALTIRAGQITAVVVPDSDFSPSSFCVKVAMPVVKKIDPIYLPDDIGVPESTSSDVGKVLTVDDNGAAAWEEPESGLPDVTAADNGKFLRVVDEKWAVVALTDVSIEGA